jgi:hypothetical protein
MKVYIYTIPKAGTYFLADFIGRLGFHNTGFHVNQKKFLNTAKFDLETNARFPSRAMERQSFMKTLRDMNDGDLAFGHFPVPLMAWIFPDFFFVCSYRHPRQTLVSEFIDFRFRRERHGQGHMAVFSQMLAITVLRNEPLCGRFQTEQFYMLNFETLLKSPQSAVDLAGRLGIAPDRATEALEQTRNAETKTKATGLDIDRAALWSDRAEELYSSINAEDYVKRGRELGWTI